jgi:hypothetical protein
MDIGIGVGAIVVGAGVTGAGVTGAGVTGAGVGTGTGTGRTLWAAAVQSVMRRVHGLVNWLTYVLSVPVPGAQGLQMEPPLIHSW